MRLWEGEEGPTHWRPFLGETPGDGRGAEAWNCSFSPSVPGVVGFLEEVGLPSLGNTPTPKRRCWALSAGHSLSLPAWHLADA